MNKMSLAIQVERAGRSGQGKVGVRCEGKLGLAETNTEEAKKVRQGNRLDARDADSW